MGGDGVTHTSGARGSQQGSHGLRPCITKVLGGIMDERHAHDDRRFVMMIKYYMNYM